MQLSALLAATLLPVGLLANPLAPAAAGADSALAGREALPEPLPEALAGPDLEFDSLEEFEEYETRDAIVDDVSDVFERDTLELESRAFKRPQYCAIVGASRVNCRAGSRTSKRVIRSLRRGSEYRFWCVRSGQCVTIKGKRNCGWHYSKDLNCFVSGHYTDNRCTKARIGGCGGATDDDVARPF